MSVFPYYYETLCIWFIITSTVARSKSAVFTLFNSIDYYYQCVSRKCTTIWFVVPMKVPWTCQCPFNDLNSSVPERVPLITASIEKQLNWHRTFTVRLRTPRFESLVAWHKRKTWACADVVVFRTDRLIQTNGIYGLTSNVVCNNHVLFVHVCVFCELHDVVAYFVREERLYIYMGNETQTMTFLVHERISQD